MQINVKDYCDSLQIISFSAISVAPAIVAGNIIRYSQTKLVGKLQLQDSFSCQKDKKERNYFQKLTLNSIFIDEVESSKRSSLGQLFCLLSSLCGIWRRYHSECLGISWLLKMDEGVALAKYKYQLFM